MSEAQYPSERLDRFLVRLPDGMRDRIKAAAAANLRSMTHEIVAALNAHLDGPALTTELRDSTADLRDRFAEAALISLLPMCQHDTLIDGITFEQHVARQSYRIADAMLAERERKP